VNGDGDDGGDLRSAVCSLVVRSVTVKVPKPEGLGAAAEMDAARLGIGIVGTSVLAPLVFVSAVGIVAVAAGGMVFVGRAVVMWGTEVRMGRLCSMSVSLALD